MGSLLYLSCWFRQDIAFAVSELSRLVSVPCELVVVSSDAQLVAAKHLLWHLQGTKDLGLVYSRPVSRPENNKKILCAPGNSVDIRTEPVAQIVDNLRLVFFWC